MADRHSGSVRESTSGTQRQSLFTDGNEPPRKKVKHLLGDDSSITSDEDLLGGVSLHSRVPDDTWTINEGFARRFEHNKKREELQKLEEKYGKQSDISQPERGAADTDDVTDTFSDSEEEDDEGILASGELDRQFQAALTAIKTKDPRVYDKRTTFYTGSEADPELQDRQSRTEEKPMHLRDYHRRNILEAVAGVWENDTFPTYSQEQDDMKASIVKEIHAHSNSTALTEQAGGGLKNLEDVTEEDFLLPKASRSAGQHPRPGAEAPMRLPVVDDAEKDPDKFLSDFMFSRAWVPNTGVKFQPFESDDEEEEKRADEFEAAYNLRFEDPSASNEKLVSHARDAAARYSVRRDALTGRKKAREIERAKREAEKQEREEEKARLRKLRIADAEEKIKKIKDAAGLRNEHLNVSDWSGLLEEGWDDKQWDQEMRKRFGETYYAERECDGDGEVEAAPKNNIKKPKWNDDVDITDIIPEFEEEEQSRKPQFRLSDIESRSVSGTGNESEEENENHGKLVHKASGKNQKSRVQKEHQSEARKERRQIERLVDQNIDVDRKLADMGPKHTTIFRYRATSPITYGLTAQDILMASDSQLNQYAGLKKLAAFRDSTKKAKDHKRLGKKARLRQWRKETFGNEQGPQQSLADILANRTSQGVEPSHNPSNIVEGTRRKKRSKDKTSVG